MATQRGRRISLPEIVILGLGALVIALALSASQRTPEMSVATAQPSAELPVESGTSSEDYAPAQDAVIEPEPGSGHGRRWAIHHEDDMSAPVLASVAGTSSHRSGGGCNRSTGSSCPGPGLAAFPGPVRD